MTILESEGHQEGAYRGLRSEAVPDVGVGEVLDRTRDTRNTLVCRPVLLPLVPAQHPRVPMKTNWRYTKEERGSA